MKAVSENKNCAIIYDSDSTDLKVYDFSGTTTRTISTSRTVPAGIYSGITITDPATKFSVSDDCSVVRINSKLGHLQGTDYEADDIYPADLT